MLDYFDFMRKSEIAMVLMNMAIYQMYPLAIAESLVSEVGACVAEPDKLVPIVAEVLGVGTKYPLSDESVETAMCEKFPSTGDPLGYSTGEFARAIVERIKAQAYVTN